MASQRAKTVVVESEMTVKPIARLFASGRVRRVDKENSVFKTRILTNNIQSIFLPETNTIRNRAEIRKSSGKCSRVPSRANALTIFAVFQEARSLGKNAPVKGTILQNGLEGFFFDVDILFSKFLYYGILREIEFKYSPCKPFCLSTNHRLPHCTYFVVEFNHDSTCDKVLKKCSQANDSTASKWLNQDIGLRVSIRNPVLCPSPWISP